MLKIPENNTENMIAVSPAAVTASLLLCDVLAFIIVAKLHGSLEGYIWDKTQSVHWLLWHGGHAYISYYQLLKFKFLYIHLSCTCMQFLICIFLQINVALILSFKCCVCVYESNECSE